jgi:hypothetical protein
VFCGGSSDDEEDETSFGTGVGGPSIHTGWHGKGRDPVYGSDDEEVGAGGKGGGARGGVHGGPGSMYSEDEEEDYIGLGMSSTSNRTGAGGSSIEMVRIAVLWCVILYICILYTGVF